ncbi:DUF6443 domain-containing protein [Tenacibaculum jejuense]|uniref:DUF6443 domain-containing protein n=1 Tax=Tenacibaculum jejuense TaxID=584609 RepID=A0A238UDL3_9FLAO|nr:DUF6443 domain-containing protein [Tenacibaculum jejuense]SNR17106.1 exported protein of unknown function [Tenacibaculum jejuense]
MRKIIYMFLLFLPLLVKAQTQVPDNRVERDLEISSANGPTVLTATNSIVLRPTTWIKPGSNFTMRIVADAYLPLSLSNENYILTRAFQTPTQTGVVSSNNDVIESVTYFDGLGRAKQSVGIKQSPGKKDIVTFIGYDDLGRQTHEYLPYTANTSNGSFHSGAKTATQQYYQSNYADDFPGITDVESINAFSQKSLEASPLNRVLSQAAPGSAWKKGAGHEIDFTYDTNTTGEVKLFRVALNIGANEKVYEPSIIGNGSAVYGVGELYKTITKDENHDGTASKLHTTEEFKNKEGQVILKRTYALVSSTEEAHDTYYVYDDFGNLTYVFPPKVNVNDGVSLVELSELSYQYKYDYRNRLVEKKIPGKDWEYIVYDILDRPVLTQDANLRSQNKWLFTKYDHLGRVVYTGIYTHNTELDQAAMQLKFKEDNNLASEQYEDKLDTAGSKSIYYSNRNFPLSNIEVLTVNYYDNYTFDVAGASTSKSLYKGTGTTTAQTKGLATGTKVKVLSTSSWITTVTLYDDKARPVYVYSQNDYLKTTDIVESKLDFVGKVEETKTTHTKAGKSPIVTVDTFSYDHAARLLSQEQKINNQATETIVTNNYDDLGQLVSKEIGGGLQKVDYDYNVRGWLTKINEDTDNDNDLFNFEIRYNNPTSGTALFNGNIAQTSWQTKNIDNSKKIYNYSYDALNRIISATMPTTSNYNLDEVGYDKNGNIIFLSRNGHSNIEATSFDTLDELMYTYDVGNKLKSVTDVSENHFGFKDGNLTGNDYTYDDNGNMISDKNKGITSIKYNHLNLPTKVTIGGKNIDYIYDAAGMKLKKIVENNTTDYAGNYIYENGVLQFFNHPEGYVKADVTSSGVEMDYVYQYKDHLGNVRLSYTDNNKDGNITQNEIIEESNYYPFGLKHKGYNNVVSSLGSSIAQRFGYNGKEQQFGTDWHDFGARNYDAALGRWMNLDPKAEEMRRWSPYNVSFNNPLRFIDPDGMKPEDIIILFYTKGNNKVFGGGDQSFKAAAETRKNDIENKKSFNKEKDIVLIREIKDISDIKKVVGSIVSEYSNKYGKTSEVGIWSHSGPLEGPMGTEKTSKNRADKYQMTMEGWGDIDFNWKNDGASCNLYGCNTGRKSYEENSFAENLSGLGNFKDVQVSGQSSTSYPSFKPYIRSTNLGRGSGSESVRNFSFSIGRTYMVGGSEGQGSRALGVSLSSFPKAKPFNTYKNSKLITTSYSPNQ